MDQRRDLMTQSVEVVQPASTLQDAAGIMERLDVGFLPVYEDGQLVGTVTDRDLTLRGADHLAGVLSLGDILIGPTAPMCLDQARRGDRAGLSMEPW